MLVSSVRKTLFQNFCDSSLYKLQPYTFLTLDDGKFASRCLTSVFLLKSSLNGGLWYFNPCSVVLATIVLRVFLHSSHKVSVISCASRHQLLLLNPVCFKLLCYRHQIKSIAILLRFKMVYFSPIDRPLDSGHVYLSFLTINKLFTAEPRGIICKYLLFAQFISQISHIFQCLLKMWYKNCSELFLISWSSHSNTFLLYTDNIDTI